MRRRKFLALMGVAGAGLALGKTPAQAASNAHFEGYPDGMAVLFDATRCIGCRKCEAGCNKVNKLPAPAKPFDDLKVLDSERRTTAKATQERPGGAKPAEPGVRGRRPPENASTGLPGRISTVTRSPPGWPRVAA